MSPRPHSIEIRYRQACDAMRCERARGREGMIEIYAAKAAELGGSGNRRSRTKGTKGMSDIGDDARRIEVNTKMLVTSLRRVTACANANCSETVAFDTNALDRCCSLKGKQLV